MAPSSPQLLLPVPSGLVLEPGARVVLQHMTLAVPCASLGVLQERACSLQPAVNVQVGGWVRSEGVRGGGGGG